jgi:hypothetical protein
MFFANARILWILLIFLAISVFLVLATFFIKKLFLKSIFQKEGHPLSDINFFTYNLKIVIFLISLIFISISLLDPRWGNKSLNVDLEGIDLVVAMDISRSMLTKDVMPDRLYKAKNLASKLCAYLVGNRVGLTAFAGYAFNMLPLTTDIDALYSFINELSTEMIDVQGTNLEDAIKKALELFDYNALTHKAIVIFTDGEDYEFSPVKQAKEAARKGVKIFTVGIGTPNGQMIPVYDENGNVVDYLKKEGKIVTSRLDENLLRLVAKETEGEYFYGSDENISALARKIDEIKKTKFSNQIYDFLEPQYQYFLAIALLLLLIYLFLPEKKVKFNFKGWIKLIFISTIISLLNENIYASLASRGVAEYRKGNYEKALELFQKAFLKDEKNEKLIFNQGNTYYKLNRMDEAKSSFKKLINSKNKIVKEKSIYNLGTTYIDKNEYQKAIETYKDILLNGDKESEIYKKTLWNFLYAKQMLNQTNQNNQKEEQNKEKENREKNNNKQENHSQKNSSSSQSASSVAPQKLSQNEVENLLNLIQEEEKKHIGRKEKAKALRYYPRNEW